jgi:hypothetical protein
MMHLSISLDFIVNSLFALTCGASIGLCARKALPGADHLKLTVLPAAMTQAALPFGFPVSHHDIAHTFSLPNQL